MRTGQRQYIDLATLDVAMMLQCSQITDYLHSRTSPAVGRQRHALCRVVRVPDQGRPGPVGCKQRACVPAGLRGDRRSRGAERSSLEERYERHAEKRAAVAEKMKEKTADEWGTYLQFRHVPATRVRELCEAVADPHLRSRPLLHRHEAGAAPTSPSRCRWEHRLRA
jgi:crotonobetainyl-CoA:carnitine CoA-transferase CaiB-like acyl-CoA transferase